MSERLRIALIAACPFPFPRGTPIRIQRMAGALAEIGHDVHVITYHLGEENGEYPYQIHRIPNIPFYRKTSPGPTFLKLILLDFLLAVKLIFLQAKIGFDIVHSHHYEGLIAALPYKLLFSNPLLYDAHTLLSSELHHYRISLPPQLINSISRVLDNTLPKFADHIISVSKSIQGNLANLFESPDDRISVIPNGVEIDLFLHQPATNPVEVDKRLVIAYAGNFAPYQRVEILFEAFKQIRQEFSDVCLEVYTEDDPSSAAELLQTLGLNSSVQLNITPFSELPERLSKTDILLNPRIDGAGHPLKLLNYMAAGKPIVTFSGSAHGLVHNETAWIVQENTTSSFSNGIITLIEDADLRMRLGRNARKYVEENHVWAVNANILTQIYQGLLAK